MLPLRLLALLATMLALVQPSSAQLPFKLETTPGNLPKDVRPVAYRIDLDLVPDPDQLNTADGTKNLDFSGRVEIDIEVLHSTQTITFNAIHLILAKVSIDGSDATIV